jgi:glycosyltransferase involved in cell wall biosynthesis
MRRRRPERLTKVPSTRDAAPRLRVISVVPSMARNTGGPAVTLVRGTLEMSGAVDRTIYATDAAQPASSKPFRRLAPSDLPERADEVALRVFRTTPPRQLGFSPALARALYRDVRHADLVTIHSLNLFPQLAAYAAARQAGKPFIVTPHGALDPWLRRNSPRAKAVNGYLWQDRMLRSADALHFTTAEEARLAAISMTHGREYVIPNGVDVERFSQPGDGHAFRDQALGGHGGTVVLFLGRVARKKGIDLLIRAFGPIARRLDAVLAVVGPDDEGLVAELARLAADVGVAERVRFVGPLYGRAQLDALAGADVWALTSYTENFGNAVVEAMAARRAVLVSTAVNLAPDVERSGAGVVTGLDAEEISLHLSNLLEDASLRAALGSRAAAFAAGYDWRSVAPRLTAMFEEVVRRHREHRTQRR